LTTEPAEAEKPAESLAQPPRWTRFAWFLGRPPGGLTDHQWRVLGLVSAVSFFEQYDVYLFSLNLKHIQADLGIAESALGWLGSLVRAGALLAVLVTLLADRVGRRKVLLFTVIAYTVLTGATALAPNAEAFVALQFLARTFAVAETLVAVVVVAEEFGPESRGWGIGALGAIQACGAGLAALLFGFVDQLPFGWRSLYFLGLVPLGLVAWWRRTLPETRRFEELARSRASSLRATPALAPMLGLVRDYPGRFAAVAIASFAFAAAQSPAVFFAPKYLQDAQGWSPGAVAALNFMGGALAILANPLAGRLSDRIGRRRVAAGFLAVWIASAIAFYNAPAFAVGPCWVLMLFLFFGAETTLSALSVEVFPTSQRSTAAGARGLLAGVGAVGGLAVVSVLYAQLGSNWAAVSAVALAAVVIPPVVLVALPETAGRSLEEVSPERS